MFRNYLKSIVEDAVRHTYTERVGFSESLHGIWSESDPSDRFLGEAGESSKSHIRFSANSAHSAVLRWSLSYSVEEASNESGAEARERELVKRSVPMISQSTWMAVLRQALRGIGV